MALDRNEKVGLALIVAILIVGAVWYVVTTHVIPYFDEKHLLEEAQALQKTVTEGTSFSLEGHQNSVDEGSSTQVISSSYYDGTLTFCVDSSRLYKSKTEMIEAEGFEGDADEISSVLDEEPLGLVVDVSITNVDATNSMYSAMYGLSTTYFSMGYFGLAIDNQSSMYAIFCGQDLHVPEYADEPDRLWNVVDIPQGQTVHVRLTFLLPPAGAADSMGKLAEVIPVYEEGDQLILYYGMEKHTGNGTSGSVSAEDFSVTGAFIPYLVELSPEIMY